MNEDLYITLLLCASQITLFNESCAAIRSDKAEYAKNDQALGLEALENLIYSRARSHLGSDHLSDHDWSVFRKSKSYDAIAFYTIDRLLHHSSCPDRFGDGKLFVVAIESSYLATNWNELVSPLTRIPDVETWSDDVFTFDCGWTAAESIQLAELSLGGYIQSYGTTAHSIFRIR
jgi:hypothetical protein